MKLSKKSWIFLGIGIFVIIFASLGAARSQQLQERARLNEELSLAKLRLDGLQFEQLSFQQEELESQLTGVESRLEAVKAQLHWSIGSIEVTDTLFQTANTCKVEIIEISSAGVTNKKLEGITCSVLSLVVTVEGDVSNLINFTTELGRKFPTGVAQSVQIKVPEVIEEEETDEEAEKPSANIELVIYSYQGD